jgi:hypothetical protein
VSDVSIDVLSDISGGFHDVLQVGMDKFPVMEHKFAIDDHGGNIGTGCGVNEM